MVELLYEPREEKTSFAVWREGALSIETRIVLSDRHELVPYSPHNNLIKHRVVLFPSTPEEYRDDETLIREIGAFIHRYVDVSETFEKIATYYVLFSWLHDDFNELPYLRLRGDYGSGKTRFLLTVGSLCYKPIFASGASTVSPIFHMLDTFAGTLMIDEGDFRLSDEKAEIVKILNNGNARGFPVLRAEGSSREKEWNPRAFSVYGPKIVATRGYYTDRALESRFIAEEMGTGKMRTDIPINLPSKYHDEALHLRNKLLLFRFRNHGKRSAVDSLVDRTIEPRLNQLFIPLMSVIDDQDVRENLRRIARDYHAERVADRGMDIEAQVLEVIRDLADDPDTMKLSIKEITAQFTNRFGGEYARTITTKWIGTVIRRKLHLTAQKSNGVFVIPPSERAKLSPLYERYGLNEMPHNSSHGDFGDIGDVAEGEERQAI